MQSYSSTVFIAWIRSEVRGAVVDGAACGEREARLEALLTNQLPRDALELLDHIDQLDACRVRTQRKAEEELSI